MCEIINFLRVREIRVHSWVTLASLSLPHKASLNQCCPTNHASVHDYRGRSWGWPPQLYTIEQLLYLVIVNSHFSWSVNCTFWISLFGKKVSWTVTNLKPLRTLQTITCASLKHIIFQPVWVTKLTNFFHRWVSGEGEACRAWAPPGGLHWGTGTGLTTWEWRSIQCDHTHWGGSKTWVLSVVE